MKTKTVISTNPARKSPGVSDGSPAGFTLVELLVVLAAIAILVALLVPGLARGNQQAEGGQCLGNLQQLGQAWLMYNSDNQGKITPNAGEGAQGFSGSPFDPSLRPGGLYAQWCPGRQDPGVGAQLQWLSFANLPPGKPNVGNEWLQAGLVYPYVKNVQVYRCPADESFNLIGGVVYPHVRSVSMNAWLSPAGNSPWTGGSQDNIMRVYLKETDLSVPGPANTFLLIDENPQSINDGWFIEDPSEPTLAKPAWIDAPAIYHNGGCGISFCDGHAGIKKWRDPTILAPNQAQDTGNWSGGVSKFEQDVFWMVNRSTALKSTTAFLGPQGW